jgi:hypothetical protein
MSNNDDSFPVLGDSEIFAVEYLPFHAIPQLCKRGDDGSESCPVFMADKALDVFKDEMSGSLVFQDSCDIKKESASRVFKSSSLPCNAEGLARESADKEVKVWEVSGVNEGSVSEVCVVKVFLISLDGGFVYFGVANTLGYLPLASQGTYDP